MRVLYVIHYPVFGGPHNQALRLSPRLQDAGWETVVLLPDEPGNAAGRLRDGGVEVVTIGLHRLRASADPRPHVELLAGLIPEIRALRRIIREREIDVVQIGGLVNPHAAIAARLERVPIVWQILDTRTPLPLAAMAMRLVGSLADVVMSTGQGVLVSHPGGRRVLDRSVTYFPPVDTRLFRPRPEEASVVRSEWGLPETGPVIGCVSNINPQKGIVRLVEAFTRVRELIPTVRLVMVGSGYTTHGAYSSKVHAAVGKAGLVIGHDVVLTGERSDVHRQLAGMDVFAFSPERRGEGITTAVLEAMSAGLPVVTADVAGMSEAIEDGVTGILVRPEDSKALAAAILRVLQDPVAARRIGAAARSQALGRFGIAASAAAHATAYEGASARRRPPPGVGRGFRRLTLEELVVCPSCRSRLTIKHDGWTCGACRRTYPQVDGIPILLTDPIREHDESNHKAAQSHHSDDAVDDEFEVTRPHGTARLYRFLLLEKFRRATAPIRTDLVAATALVVCGGSGMDAEFLARSGAAVVSSDISLGAARRARERARRYGLDITVCVADAENLPFTDGAFDLAYVHDGLHHLERPDVALREMARVARRWVSISEPARARVTAVAVHAGLAREREEAGNVVLRLSPDTVVGWVEAAGYRPLVSERYAMYYRHKPGIVTDLLSARWSFPLTRLLWHVGNRVVGRAGNKMVVVAERHAPPTDSVVQSGPAQEDPHE